ncbi:MAG: hypothetical protein IRZ13_04460 [Acetobacteraceae bacterium]|nr:hypothetical protein [Acetobacteraceae bacterium]
MSAAEHGTRPTVAPPEEDPNATVVCSSPPCFLHELDPSYLGYLGRDELRTLLAELMAAAAAGAMPGGAGLHARLRSHAERLGVCLDRSGPDMPAAEREPPLRGDRLARRIREALPRLQDEALRHELEALLATPEAGSPEPPRASRAARG